MISIYVFLSVELVAAAVLALWVIARYPRFGPTSLRTAIALVAVGLIVLQLVSGAVALVSTLPHGTYLALFSCVLPSYFAVFLAAGWVMRLLAGALGGSGGGTGHRAPAPSRY